MGLAGLGTAWRTANRVWGVPGLVGELILLIAVCVWGALLVLYAAKWVVARDAARAELEVPVQCCFVGLIGVATAEPDGECRARVG